MNDSNTDSPERFTLSSATILRTAKELLDSLPAHCDLCELGHRPKSRWYRKDWAIQRTQHGIQVVVEAYCRFGDQTLRSCLL